MDTWISRNIMKFSLTLASLAAIGGVQAAAVPPCKACRQDSCMDAIIQSECGDYLVIVETPATQTVFETAYVSVVPTEISLVTLSTTVINNVTTTVPVVAYSTIDYTVTVTAEATATDVVSETRTVTAQPTITAIKRADEPVEDDDYDIPGYASACTNIFQYSSACDCVGFTPGTSTAPAPVTTSTITSTVTPTTSVIVSTVETVIVTETGSTIPVTVTVSTVSVSQAIETVTTTTVVATTLTTEVAFTTVTPVPAPTPTIYISLDDGSQLEDIRVPPGAEIGVIATIRQTTLPARVSVNPITGVVTLIQNPATTVPYALYFYARNLAFSYAQLTTQRVANILGVATLQCRLEANVLICKDEAGTDFEPWLCGRHLAMVYPGQGQVFTNSCAGGAARKVTLTARPA
ncbi:hypothetical protein HJFPF1_10886 [Paramyrothecium foliicola]|nr:hypothetical protein HJFPF1_10886 [Paramyrothecium foliicola]